MLVDRHIDEGDPARGAFLRLQVEMLVLDAARRHRQKDEIAFLPILALAVDDRIALTFQHVDQKAALMAVLAGNGFDFVHEDPPVI